MQGFNKTYATGAACQQRTLTPPNTWSSPTLWLACVLMSRPIYPELVLSPDLWISNTPRYFSFPLRGSVIDLTHAERVSISTSSFLAHRLVHPHASMMISKFWFHQNETGTLYFGPLRKRPLSCWLWTICRSPETIGPHWAYRNSESQQEQGVPLYSLRRWYGVKQ